MSFIVSNGFNLHGTIDRLQLLQWFHFRLLGSLETTSKNWAGVSCSKVSVVSYIIHLLNETQKLLRGRLRTRVHIDIAAQDYTKQPAAGRGQPV